MHLMLSWVKSYNLEAGFDVDNQYNTQPIHPKQNIPFFLVLLTKYLIFCNKCLLTRFSKLTVSGKLRLK